MSLYSYRAYNAAGQSVSGTLDADSLTALETRLRAAGIWLLEAREGRVARREEETSRTTLKRAELIGFFVQMTLLLRAGITLPQALQRLAEDSRDTDAGTVFTALHEQVTIGVPLHEAMAGFPRIFSDEVRAVIEAGEVSGKLPDVFESLQGYFDWLDQLVSDVRQAMTYPLIVLGASIVLILLLFTIVVPKFVTLLTELQLEVPTLTRIVMTVSDALLRGWPVLLALAVAAPLGWRAAMRSPGFAVGWDTRLMALPVFGPLIAMIALSKFAHNLALLYRAGIPLLRGLEICRDLVGNRAVAAAVDAVRRGVLEGKPMSRCLANHPEFPPTLVTMIATGETSGTLDFALQSIANYYNKVIPRRIKAVFAVFNPAMMLTLIGLVGTVALSVILPILQLWNAR